MKITLLGYMGCGKTQVGRELARQLQCAHLDLDAQIEARAQCSVRELFARKSERHFRALEHSVLGEFLEQPNAILSLGGGTPAYYDNMERIRQKSRSIYLRIPVRDLTERLRRVKSQRPLIAELKDEDLSAFIAKHLFERAPYYKRAEHIVDTDNRRSVQDNAAEILKRL